MQLNFMICSLFAVILGGCSPDYSIIGGKTETIYVETEVEVPVYVETEVPADSGLVWVDSFNQPKSVDGVDILWVIDTSGSMNAYDSALMNGLDVMLSALPPAGWRLAMIPADPNSALSESQFPLVPGDDVADALAMYTVMGRGGQEEGFDSVYEYVMNNPYSLTWMRPDAALLVVFVSDEEEQSNDHFTVVQDFVSWYASLRSGGVYLSSIVNFLPTDSVCDQPPSIRDVGERYMEATDFFAGTKLDICSEDWSSGVADASAQIEPYEKIVLTHEAIADSVRVFVDGLLYNDWHYVDFENTVYFDVLPEGGTLVEVGYRYHEDPDTGGDTAA